MGRETTGSLLSAVFVDYDNIYLSLKRKNAEAAKRFAKNASVWISAIASGELITPTNSVALSTPRRIVMNRCYGNPVPRRSAKDNATDMNSFPFVRHHYLRAGFEIVDCPPLTAQLKNSADIRMVMDVRDYLLHDTYFDEFIILSGDADFTPVLHRLRAHARRTVIYANDYTAAPYRAISDGEIRESALISLLTGGDIQAAAHTDGGAIANATSSGLPTPQMLTTTRSAIINEVVDAVRSTQDPVPLEALADRAVRILGHDKTVGTAWGGMGSFRDLLAGGLPNEIKMSDDAPYYVFDAIRQRRTPIAATAARTPQQMSAPQLDAPAPTIAPRATSVEPRALPNLDQQQFAPPIEARQIAQPTLPIQSEPAPERTIASAPAASPRSHQPKAPEPQLAAPARPSQAVGSQRPEPASEGDDATSIQRSIAVIHEACQAPPLSPPEYRVLFEVMAGEIKTNGLTGARTLVNIVQAAQDLGVNLRRDDARFILEVVSEADPWFEQGASAQLFASRFRNFVVARCRGQGINLSADKLDLIDAWFSGTAPGVQPAQAASPAAAPAQHQPANTQISADAPTQNPSLTGFGDVVPATAGGAPDPFGGIQTGHSIDDDEFPRIIRSRARG